MFGRLFRKRRRETVVSLADQATGPMLARRRHGSCVAALTGALGLALLLAGCGSGSKGSASPGATPTARPAASPTAQAAHSALDAMHGSYDVGAYYFSGWSHGQNDNLNPLLLGKYRAYEPLIGWYDDSQSLVDKHIEQASNAGIDFFAFDWYDIAASPYPTDRTLDEGLQFYLTSHLRDRLKFCVVFVDQAPFIPSPPAQEWPRWPRLVHTWINLFKQPGYMRVNGKPLFIVFSPEHMRDIFGGSAGVHRALDTLRADARAAGLPGVTVAVAATVAPHSNPIHVQELNAEGYDAATGYNYHSLGHEQYRVPASYAQLEQENIGTWNRVATGVHVPYMPVVTSGWDQRFSYREQQTAIIYDGRSPQKFACFAVQARHWVDTHPTQTAAERVVMIFAWNEIGEGGAIVPNHHDGYAYADAVRTVFGGPGQAPSTPSYCR